MQFVDAIKYKKEVEELYVSAFPKDERAPIKLLYKRLKRKENKFYAIEENSEFIGLVYLITKGDIAYIFFFAIVEDKRGQGYGTRTLSLIKEMYKNYRICLMIEDTNIVDTFKEKRAKALYSEDERQTLRQSHHNTQVQALYKEFLGEPNSHKAHELLHTHYGARVRFPEK